MALSLKSFATVVQDSAAAVQGACAQLLDLTVGSALRAVLEANASVALWVQWLIVQVLALTRAATSTGADLDSWMGDFSLARLPAVAASGSVTFSRFSTPSSALIQPGVTVRTGDLSQSFTVTTDTTNSLWSVAQSGYLIPAGTVSGTVPVQAATAGAAGNVQANTISLIGSSIPGIDTVNNAAPLLNGADAESDAALRARFVNYINTRARATVAAVDYAVQSVQQGLTYSVAENVNTLGTAQLGNFVVTVDDGTGSPPSTLLSTVQTAVDAVRPIGTTFAVQAPVKTVVNVSLTISVAAGAVKANIQPLVATAIKNYVDALPIGSALFWTRIAQLAYDASPSITNVASVTLNGATADITVTPSGVVKYGTVAVN